MRITRSKAKKILYEACLIISVIYYCFSAMGLYIGYLEGGIFFGFIGLAYLILGVDFGRDVKRNKPE